MLVVSDIAVLRKDRVKILSFEDVGMEVFSEVPPEDSALGVTLPVVVVKELSLETVNSSVTVDEEVASWVGSWVVVL